MEAIKICKSCAVRGKGHKEGEVLVVGKGVSHDDAVVLVRMGRAVEAKAPREPDEKRGRAKEKD